MSQQVLIIVSLLSVLFVWVIAFWLYPDYRNDTFRQGMFKIRDEFFDEARLGRISFDDKAYGILRTMMNGCIRFAHLLNIAHLLIVAWTDKGDRAGKGFADRLNESVEGLKEEERKIYLRYLFL